MTSCGSWGGRLLTRIGVPQEPEKSLRENFKQVLLPQVFKDSIKAINKTTDGREWLSDKQLEDIIFVIKIKNQVLKQNVQN